MYYNANYVSVDKLLCIKKEGIYNELCGIE